MIEPALLIFWSFVQVFVICDACQRVTGHYDEIDIYFQWDWYEFPKDVRRDLPLAIIGMHQPVELKGLGNIECTRDTFKKVTFS